MPEQFVPSGVELIARGLGKFLSDLNTANKAIASVGVGAGKEAAAALLSIGKNVQDLGKSASSVAGTFINAFQSIGSSILSIGKTAALVAAGGVAALAAGLIALGALALSEFAKYERMALSIQSLVARDIAQGTVVQQQRQVMQQLTKAETEELQGLAQKIKDEELSRATLGARIKEESESLRQLTAEQGENALNVGTATARLKEMENEYNKSGTAIQEMKDRQVELTDKTGDYITVMTKVRTGQIDMNTAMAQAGPKAQELLKWIAKLAVLSPFTEEGIDTAFQTALAYGFNVEQAKRLTTAEVDYAAATGKSVDATNLIALALGQMQAKGKVSGQEIIQLTNAGVGVNKILEDMGFTLDDVSNGLVDSDKFIEAVIKDMEVFKGAAAKQATTFSGLISSLSDLKSIGLREFFTGTFQAIQPYLADFVGKLTSAALETGSIRAIGDAFGTYVAAGLAKTANFLSNLYNNIREVVGIFEQFGARGAALNIATKLGITLEAVELLGKFKQFIIDTATTISTVFAPVLESMSGEGFMAGLNATITFLNENFESLKGALIGIGAVLAGGVFVAIAAGIASLVTPVTILIGAAALLGAAWGGNWFGIRDKTLQVWTQVQPVLIAIGKWLGENIPIAIKAVTDHWNNFLLPALKAVGEFITTYVLPALATLGEFLVNNTSAAIKIASELWTNTFLPAITSAGTWIRDVLIPAISELVTWLMDNLKKAIDSASALWQNTLLPAMVAVNDYVGGNLIPLLESIGRVLVSVTNVAVEAAAGLWQNVLYPALKKAVDLVANHVKPMFDALARTFNNVIKPALEDIGDIIEAHINPIFAAIGSVLKSDVNPAMQEMGGDILPLLKEGLDEVAAIIKRATDYFNSLADAANNFRLPDVLMPGSPPPMAIALMDVANSAAAATDQMGNLSSMMHDISANAQNMLAGSLGFSARMFLPQEGLEEDERNVAENSIKAAYAKLFDRIRAGNAGVNELMAEFKAGLAGGFFDATEISQAVNAVDFAGIVASIRTQFGQLTTELKLQVASLGQSFAGIGSQWAGMLQEDVDAFNESMKAFEESKQKTKELADEGEKLRQEHSSQTSQLDILKRELALLLTKQTELTTGQGLDSEAIEKNSIAIEKKKQALDKLKNATGDNSVQIDILTRELNLLLAKQEELTTSQGTDTDAIEKNAIALDKKREAIEKLTTAISDNQKAILSNEQAVKDQQSLFQKLQTLKPGEAVDKYLELTKSNPAATIQILQEFLDSGKETFRLIGHELGGVFAGSGVTSDVFWDRVGAQQELNRLLEEQAKKEELILKQKEAQQKLDFLRSQLEFIKLGQQLGGDVLKGFNFGLDANIEDLLKMANTIVETFVTKLDEGFDLGSPSRLTRTKFGQVMQGAILGVQDYSRELANTFMTATKPIVNADSMIMGRMQSINNTTSNIYNMAVTTGASASSVVQQYEVTRSLHGA